MLEDSAGCELAEEVLRSSGHLRLKVTGSSMLPAIWPGDVLSIVREGAQEAAKGEILLFGRNGGLVVHRVVAIRKTKSEVRRPRSEVQILDSKFKIPNSASRVANPESRVPTPDSLIFVTRGDSLPSADSPALSAHELLGRVVAIERGSRRFAPRRSAVGRLVAWMCAHSDLATRILLKAHLELRRRARGSAGL